MKQQSRYCIKSFKEGQPTVNPEASRGQNPEYHLHVMIGRISGDDPFNNHDIDNVGVEVHPSEFPV